MYELKNNGKVFTSKSVGTGPSSYGKRIYRAAVSRSFRNTAMDHPVVTKGSPHLKSISLCFLKHFSLKVALLVFNQTLSCEDVLCCGGTDPCILNWM